VGARGELPGDFRLRLGKLLVGLAADAADARAGCVPGLSVALAKASRAPRLRDADELGFDDERAPITAAGSLTVARGLTRSTLRCCSARSGSVC
jgi:hypothetical protein